MTRKFGLYIMISMCLIAIMVCMICDYAITKNLTWSLIVLLSLIAAWLVLAPLFTAENKAIKKSLIAVSIITFPFLAGLSAVLGSPLVLSMGSGIAALSIAAAWGIYGAFVKYKNRIFLALAISLLITIPLTCGITRISAYFEGVPADLVSELFHISTTLVLSGACFIVDLVRAYLTNIRKG